ncbi:Uncharacterised protein [Mycobacteroides abscessus subsp. abscessus]|nr:Uncharacterised protein [Mycobacteroides abscessus subsp. abscessus]SKW54455.1 Uncharacterised protein [Mycobacteroides abscessus subsp. abscessus]
MYDSGYVRKQPTVRHFRYGEGVLVVDIDSCPACLHDAPHPGAT